MPIEIPNTSGLIAECWSKAETRVLEQITDRHWDVHEEFITTLLRGELRDSFRIASRNHEFARALHADLERALIGYNSVTAIGGLTSGLQAQVDFHRRDREGKTGGDFGLVLQRPNVTIMGNTLKIEFGYARGLLCQAKLSTKKNGTSKWGKFTKKQKVLLPGRLNHLALLLYEYQDEDLKRLRSFQWLICRDAAFDDIEKWLRTNAFKALESSTPIWQKLADGSIGTDNEEIIREQINPKDRDTLVVKIDWPNESRPDSEIQFNHPILQEEEQKIHLTY